MSLKPRIVNFEETWERLLKTVQAVIQLADIKRCTWNDRFSDVYALCVAFPEPHSERLYSETKCFLENHVNSLRIKVANAEENLLSLYHKFWQQFSKGASYMDQLYSYLNQHSRKQKTSDPDRFRTGTYADTAEEDLMDIGELALDIWKRLMIMPLDTQLQGLLLRDMHRDRAGEDTQQSVLHSVINSLVEVEQYRKKEQLKLYQDLFETKCLEQTGAFYRKESARLLQNHNCSQYMEKVLQRLQEEQLRSHKFLHPSSYHRMLEECQKRMVADHMALLHAECRTMVRNEQRQDLSRMYELLKPIPNGLSIMVQELEAHIVDSGRQAIAGLHGDNIPVQFVDAMLTLHTKFSEMIATVFNKDQLFTKSLDMACSSVVNHKISSKQVTSRSPELLARHCDALLKKSSKGSSESELDDRLGQCILVFRYIDDKDIFQRFYARMLAKRLIHGLSTSMDAEEAMINKLKQACGYEFTNKLHRMFTDMGVSEDLNAKFSNFCQEKETYLGINFSIYVLTTGSWPLGQSALTHFAISQELEKSVRMFELFYSEKFPGRKLTWLHHLCTAELKLNFLKKPYIVTATTFQMAVLLIFNGQDSVQYSELVNSALINEKELAKTVQSLVDVKFLEQTPAGAFTDTTCFTLNQAYSNKRTKFKITMAVQREPPQQEVEHTHNAVDEDRKLYLQAAIVRIMKARKKLKHNILIQEVIGQARSRFSPSISMIKKCIEALIDKQYLERTQATDEYAYVA
ncbi:cullin-2-like [Diadema antillarum]|uniref:cullin-2-like n=2 Tax=Diadema antillarum TaxID=105358 RepID=UPI003A849ED6